ncbi:MAG: hypothetical protein ABSF84_12535 [Acidimicrobiales bacterium]|jgi:hypothetical protein
MAADELEEISAWMHDRFVEEDYRAIWMRRCSLGAYPNKECSREALFWLAAYPAIVALRKGLYHDWLAVTCIGQARMLVDPHDELQMSFVSEIDQRFPRD